MRRTILTFILAILSAAGSLHGATFTVTSLADGGPGSLRQAVLDANAAAGADEIVFDGVTGTITLSSEILISDALTITGPGAGLLSITCTGATGLLKVDGGAAGTIQVALTGLTLTGSINMFTFGGGAVAVQNGSLTLTDSVVTGNQAHSGGGLYLVGGTHVIRNTTVSGNSAQIAGPGVGGGIYISGGALTIENSTLSGNSASQGALHLGAMGGGMMVDSGATVNVINSTFSGNSVSGDGAAIRVDSSTLNLFLTTVTDNSASWFFRTGLASLSLSAGTINIVSSIVANTEGEEPVDLYLGSGTINATYSLIETPGAAINGTNLNNITGADPQLGPLQDNGGPTATHALLPGSPAINSGDPAVADDPPFDQRGPGFPRVHGGNVDMGAFEFELLPIEEIPVLSPLGMVLLIAALLAAGTGILTRRSNRSA